MWLKNMVYIKQISETSVTIEALYALSKDAYRIWSEHGLDEPWMHRTIGEFKEAISDTMVFMALDAENHELLGMHCFRGNLKKKCAYGLYLAVSPKVLKQGVATKMIAYTSEYLLNAGFTHLIGGTTIGADWSVCWHLKNGYNLIGFKRAKSGCLDSYVFRKQLLLFDISTWSGMMIAIRHPRYSLYSSKLFCRCRFWYKHKTETLRASFR